MTPPRDADHNDSHERIPGSTADHLGQPGRLDEDAPAQPITSLPAETRVRIIDQANLGVTGTVAERPKQVRRADGVAVDVMTITTPDNKSRVVAANNVEVIA